MKFKRLFNAYAASIALIFSIGSTNAADTDTVGNQVVSDLTQRYQSKVEGCGADKSLPAFECSGVIARITGHGGSYDPWNPSPTSQRSGGVSFLYWRGDIVPASFGGNNGNGFILNVPEKSQASGKISPYVLCYFPMNAYSVARGGEGGCGTSSGTYADDKSPCQLQSIYTAEQWYTHYISKPTLPMCGFNVRDYRKAITGNAQSAFYEGIRVSSLFWQYRAENSHAASAVDVNNEMIIRTWEQNIPGELPIQAFFYLAGGDNRQYAMHDQKLFHDKTKMFIPVIKVSVPVVDKKAAEFPQITFSYQAEDQAVQAE